MILIDSSPLLLLLIGTIDRRQINSHKRTSIYEEQDFDNLVSSIPNLSDLVVLPNVWTEVDNLLNNFSGKLKNNYILSLREAVAATTERYIETIQVIDHPAVFDLGITDSLLLYYSEHCDLLITADSNLSDYALARGVKVYDLVKQRNLRL